MQTMSVAVAYGVLFLLMGAVFFGGGGAGVGAGRPAVFPWEVAAVIVGAIAVGALFLRRTDIRMAVELVLGFVLFLGVWVYAWFAFGELGLVVAGAATLAQALFRKVWVHDTFVLVGTAGAALYLAFLFPASTWAILLVGLAMYDIVGERGRRVMRHLAHSVVHRGVFPALILSATPRAFLHPLTEEIREKTARSFGMAELVFPSIIVAHAAVLGVASFWVTAVAVGTVAAWCVHKQISALLLPLALGALLPYLLFVLLLL